MNRELPDEKRDATARLNLWLVDDNEEFRQGFGALLKRRFGFQHIHHFETAETAIEALRNAPAPDVVLLDLKLPGMSGVDAISLIRAKSPSTRIFMLTTYFDVASATRATAEGAVDYLTKNQRYEDIVAAVCSAGRGKNPTGMKGHADCES